MDNRVYIDFEFSNVSENFVKLVCAATHSEVDGKKIKWWLHKDIKAQEKLLSYIRKHDLVIGYSCVAEARSFMALGEEPLNYNWIDLFIEYRMLTNHSDKWQYGKQLKDGKIIEARKPRPKWQRDEDEDGGVKLNHSLVEATYKILGIIRDEEHKKATRDLIISDPKTYSEKEKKQIMDYCMEDVDLLQPLYYGLHDAICENYKEHNESYDNYTFEAINRGKYSVHTAHMEQRGYPIDVKATRNFSKKIPDILFKVQKEINTLFPDVKPFRFNRLTSKYQWDQKATRKWIEDNHDISRWPKTDGGKSGKKMLSTSLESFQKFYNYAHSYPENLLGAQFVRYLKLKQSLNGFSESKNKKSFWDSVGSDGRVRPYMNHFGAQSSRSQPAATGFLFLKPAWMRALCVPEKGKFVCGIDYGQQEFYIAALQSGDMNMINAYLSGDPYLYGAKLAGAIPKDGTKESHPEERNLYKNTYLGILYGMTKVGLAIKLSNDMGREVDEDFAQEQIDIFEETFPDYIEYKAQILESYEEGNPIILPDGWTMWGDNDNPRSVQNVPTQGAGAVIMRRAVDIAARNGAQILFTLHDAIYMEGNVGQEEDIAILYDAMIEAFVETFPDSKKKFSQQIKLDPFAWSKEYKPNSFIEVNKTGIKNIGGDVLRVPSSDLYIDDRSLSEWNKFSKYFDDPEWECL